MDAVDVLKRTDAIVEQIKPLLAHQPPPVQGFVVADLLAIWLHGYQGPDQSQARKALCAEHMQTVWKLVDYYDDKLAAERLHEKRR